MFLDFRKAFDCVDHNILKPKLINIGITDVCHSLLSLFLQGREQYVSLGQKNSDYSQISIGVPQGSILAPTLFLIYIDDLLALPLYSTAYAYADDTVFILGRKSISELITDNSHDLDLIQTWCEKNGMILNMKKSHYLLHSGPQHRGTFSITLKDGQLPRRNKTNLLGFVLNDSLSWSDHNLFLFYFYFRFFYYFKSMRLEMFYFIL